MAAAAGVGGGGGGAFDCVPRAGARDGALARPRARAAAARPGVTSGSGALPAPRAAAAPTSGPSASSARARSSGSSSSAPNEKPRARRAGVGPTSAAPPGRWARSASSSISKARYAETIFFCCASLSRGGTVSRRPMWYFMLTRRRFVACFLSLGPRRAAGSVSTSVGGWYATPVISQARRWRASWRANRSEPGVCGESLARPAGFARGACMKAPTVSGSARASAR